MHIIPTNDGAQVTLNRNLKCAQKLTFFKDKVARLSKRLVMLHAHDENQCLDLICRPRDALEKVDRLGARIRRIASLNFGRKPQNIKSKK